MYNKKYAEIDLEISKKFQCCAICKYWKRKRNCFRDGKCKKHHIDVEESFICKDFSASYRD